MKCTKGPPDSIPIQEHSETFLKRNIKNKKKPAPPITSISESILTMKDHSSLVRNFILIPFTCFFIVISIFIFSVIYIDWKKSEQAIIGFASSSTNELDPTSLPHNSDKKLTKYLNVIKDNNLDYYSYLTKISFSSRISHQAETSPLLVIFLAIFLTLCIMFLVITTIFIKRNAYIYFDRERKIVYSWSRGVAMAQRYENLHYKCDHKALVFYLRHLNPEKEDSNLWTGLYIIQPALNPFRNIKKLNENVLCSVVKFMELGQIHVHAKNWQGRNSLFFFKDKIPDNFEIQVEQIIRMIEIENYSNRKSIIIEDYYHHFDTTYYQVHQNNIPIYTTNINPFSNTTYTHCEPPDNKDITSIHINDKLYEPSSERKKISYPLRKNAVITFFKKLYSRPIPYFFVQNLLFLFFSLLLYLLYVTIPPHSTVYLIVMFFPALLLFLAALYRLIMAISALFIIIAAIGNFVRTLVRWVF